MSIKQDKDESEKVIERKLGEYAKKKGGYSIKMLTSLFNGLPDRLVLLPPGVIYFVELKSTKGRLSRAQQLVHTKLRCMGFKVFVVSSRKQLDKLEEQYEQFETEVLAWRAQEQDRKKAARRAATANRDRRRY